MQISTTLFALTTVVCSTSAIPLLSTLNSAVASVVSTAAPVTSPVFGVAGGPVGGTLNTVVALLSSTCPSFSACNTTVSGQIANMLSNGADYTGKASIAGWCNQGHCYGGTQLAGSIPAPFTITCDPKVDSCIGVISGTINQTFVNGPQIELWGWVAPTGYCANGTCTGSVTILGDPAY